MSDTNRQWLLRARPVGRGSHSRLWASRGSRRTPDSSRSGRSWEVDVQKGFENAPKTLLRLYTGANFGEQLLEL